MNKPDVKNESLKLVSVYTVTSSIEAEALRLALEAEGIACEVGGPQQGALTGIMSVDILVAQKDAEQARALLEKHNP